MLGGIIKSPLSLFLSDCWCKEYLKYDLILLSQVTVPRYRDRDNHLTITFSMLCPGISQNTKHHHLTLYKGQVLSGKSYPELCNDNVLNTMSGYARGVHNGNWNGSELFEGEADGFVREYTCIPYFRIRDISRLCSYHITSLSLVESFVVMKNFPSDATPALLCRKEPAEIDAPCYRHFWPFAGSYVIRLASMHRSY